MNASVKKLFWFGLGSIVVVTALSALIQYRTGDNAQREVMELSHSLWKQGFKTQFDDFAFTNDTATRARMAKLTVFEAALEFNGHIAEPDFLPWVSKDAAVVVWKQDCLTDRSGPVDWLDLHTALETNQAALDAACSAALSGPIHFEPDFYSSAIVLDEYLSPLSDLLRNLSCGEMLELHDGNLDAAWTNLLAATRITTAWEQVPTIKVCAFRPEFAEIAFADTWQAIQHAPFTDARLAMLQEQWESANFLTNLPDFEAFLRVVTVNGIQRLNSQPAFENFSLSDWVKGMFRDTAYALSEVKNDFGIWRYQGRELLTDEKKMLLYSRDREVELRHAIQSPTWFAMRAQPGVTNVPEFQSSYLSLTQTVADEANLEAEAAARTAEMEARRRILITAIALERYHGRHGVYPATLSLLAPEFINSVPVDFMDGKPLRYRLTDDGHFVLYSVGLDCVDDGGKMPMPGPPKLDPVSGFPVIPTGEDIVWPRPDPATDRTPRP